MREIGIMRIVRRSRDASHQGELSQLPYLPYVASPAQIMLITGEPNYST